MYDKILARRIGIDYGPGIQFQTGLVNMDKAKALTMNNQTGKSTDKKNRYSVAPQITYVSPQMNDLQGFPNETQKKALGMGIYQKQANKVA